MTTPVAQTAAAHNAAYPDIPESWMKSLHAYMSTPRALAIDQAVLATLFLLITGMYGTHFHAIKDCHDVADNHEFCHLMKTTQEVASHALKEFQECFILICAGETRRFFASWWIPGGLLDFVCGPRFIQLTGDLEKYSTLNELAVYFLNQTTSQVKCENLLKIVNQGCCYRFSVEKSTMINHFTKESITFSPETFKKVDEIAKKNILSLFKEDSSVYPLAKRFVDKQPDFKITT